MQIHAGSYKTKMVDRFMKKKKKFSSGWYTIRRSREKLIHIFRRAVTGQ